MRGYDVIYTAVPASGSEALPPPRRSRISPPVPVAAPLKGSTVVGKLCVSAFSEITVCTGFSTKSEGSSGRSGENCVTRGPDTNATLSLYADTSPLGFSFDVFLIMPNSDEGISSPSIINVPLKIL